MKYYTQSPIKSRLLKHFLLKLKPSYMLTILSHHQAVNNYKQTKNAIVYRISLTVLTSIMSYGMFVFFIIISIKEH